MEISRIQLHRYRREGYLFLRRRFSTGEINNVLQELPELFSQDLPGKVLEKDTEVIRSIYGAHKVNSKLHDLSHHTAIVLPARQILSGDVYIHQFKINVKAAFKGDEWRWHQDFIFWSREDGMREANATTAAVFLDDVTDFNGPLLLIPRSHKMGMIDPVTQEKASSWLGGVIADLKYSVPRDVVGSLVAQHGMIAPKGPAGSVLFFHCNIVHGSATNMSPCDRRIAYVTFNHVQNSLPPSLHPRPEFLACRSVEPI